MRPTHFFLPSSVLRHCVLPLNHLIIEMHIMMLERIPLKLCEPFIQRGTGFPCLFSAHLLLREGESAPLYTSAKSRYLDCHFTPFNHFCHNIHALSEKGRHFKAYLDGLKVNEQSNEIGQLRVQSNKTSASNVSHAELSHVIAPVYLDLRVVVDCNV